MKRGRVINESRIRDAYTALRLTFVDFADLISVKNAAQIVGVTPQCLRTQISKGRLSYAFSKLLDRREVLAYRDRVKEKGNARRGRTIRRTKHGVLDNSRLWG